MLVEQLPPYLKAERKDGFLAALKAFPDCKPIFKKFDDPEPLQGDCWNGVLFLKFPTGEQKRARAILLTNSCDASVQNIRFNPAQLSFAPVINLENYQSKLSKAYSPERVADHISDIRAQRYTSVFFLPGTGPLNEDCIALLDQIQSALLHKPCPPNC